MDRADAPLSGVLRCVYFLAVAFLALFLVITGVAGLYEPPGSNSVSFQNIDSFSGTDGATGGVTVNVQVTDSQSARDDYNRNVSIILIVVAAGAFASAILAFGSRFNPLRAGLLAGGLVIYLAGIAFWAGASNQWTGFLMSLLAFVTLVGAFPFLEEGLPLRYVQRPVRHIDIHPAAPAEPPPSAQPQPPTDDPPYPPL